MAKLIEIEHTDYLLLMEIIDLWGDVVRVHNKFLYETSREKIDVIVHHVENVRTGDGTIIAGEIESVLDFMNTEDG